MNLKALLFTVIIAFVLVAPLKAHNDCWVFLKDKEGVVFDPYAYFDEKAIERRARNGVDLYDITDWPGNEKYVQAVGQYSDSILFVSRWFNALAISATEDGIACIRRLPFVSSVERIEPYNGFICGEESASVDEGDSLLMIHQLSSLEGNLFYKAGVDGKGVRIAIFDVGFPGVKENPAFQEIIADGRLISTKDFTRRKGENVFWGKSHGTHVWSCIGGKIGNMRLGLATGAEFLLAKTEVNREPFSEEINWMEAAEWADKNGADIINSSLGYTRQRYFPWQMDGRTSYVARAANMAAGKGILVVNAAGNDGDNDWHTLGTPADADSVLAVGGIHPGSGFHTSFSSFGPTSDKRRKPNVSAYGHVIVSGSSKPVNSQGTSFASPLVAGFAACVLQIKGDMPVMDLFHEIEKSGNLYPYFDYAHGYGLPQASYFVREKNNYISPVTIIETADSVKVLVDKKRLPNNNVIVDSQGYDKTRYLYYNIMNARGVLDYYYVLDVTEQEVLGILRKNYPKGETLNIHFAGFTHSVKL